MLDVKIKVTEAVVIPFNAFDVVVNCRLIEFAAEKRDKPNFFPSIVAGNTVVQIPAFVEFDRRNTNLGSFTD